MSTSHDGQVNSTTAPGAGVEDVVACPASGVQKGLWFLDRLQPGRASYNIVTAFELRGDVRWEILQQCIDLLVERHEPLRTSFGTQDGQPVQIIHPTAHVPIVRVAVDPGDDAEGRALRLAAAEGATPFDLTVAPLLRARAISVASEHHVVVFTIHHIVSDGWSQVVLFEELGALYTALTAGEPSPLGPVPIQYADFTLWQEKRLTPSLRDTQLGYWRDTLRALPDPVDLAVDGHRPATPSGRGGLESWTLDAALTESLRGLCRSESVTVFMAMVAVLKVFLFRYTGQGDLVIGAPVAARPRPELEHTIGFFANTLAIRTDLTGNPTFRDVLGRVRASALGAYEHQDVPFFEVVQAVRPNRSTTQTSVFQVMCAAQRAPDALLTLSGVSVRPLTISNGTAKFDLLLEIQEHRDVIEASLEYNADILDAETCRRWIGALTTLMTAACSQPECPIATLPIITPAEVRTIASWNRPAAEPASNVTIVSLFEERVRAFGDRPAVSYCDQMLTFGELDAEANRLARYLGANGIQPGDRVGLCIERSLDVAIAVLGVLKAGAAYVPMDVSYPVERLRFMAEDAGLSVVLTNTQVGADALGPAHAHRVLADWRLASAAEGKTPPLVEITASSACYVMYTSGSTGQPKGVVMPHGPLVNLMEWQIARSASALTTLQYGSLSFDVSFQEFFATWLSGGRLVIAPEAARRDPRELLKLLRHARVERLFLPFVALQLLTEAATTDGLLPTEMREVITAGEQLRITAPVRRFFKALPQVTLDNQYGPTEAHVVTAHRLTGDASTWPELPPIGRPIANARIHLLDSSLERVPVGVTGELWIGGACVADGYWHRAELTEKAFRTVPIDGQLERMYKSGDSARYRPDGTIEFLGRRDDQVKIRGFRVEPAEIEAVLATCPGVRQATVIARSHTGGIRLVAYYVPDVGAALGDSRIREFLSARLPDYLVPSAFVSLSAFPLTPSGKLDRAALPAPETVARSVAPEALPESASEQAIAAIWRDVLGLSSVGTRENFFDVGGHSLAALRLFAKIEATMGVSLPLSTLFDAPTISDLARLIDRSWTPGGQTEWRAIATIKAGVGTPLVYIHTLSGDLPECRDIARHLAPEQPVIGIQAVLGDRVDEVYGSLQATAAAYITKLRHVQPEGPYYLCGWSSGGTLALEMAQQLVAAGVAVPLLGIIDSAPYNVTIPNRQATVVRWARQIANVPAWVRDDLLMTSPAEIRARMLRKLSTWRRRWGRASTQTGTVRDVVNFPRRSEAWERFVELHYRAFKQYVPKPYPGRVSLFVAPTHPLTWLNDPVPAWRCLAQDVDVYQASGTHFSIIKEPNVQVLAAGITQAIDKARRPRTTG